MQTRTLGALVGAALFVACFVDRASDKYECTTQADCAGFPDGRMCSGGYCIVPNCPPDCKTCNEVDKTCLAECTSGESCGTVSCPPGWTCTINCTGGNACSDITCNSQSKCLITCSGFDACETVRCASACKCDLTCAAGACNTPDCPVVGNPPNQTECTVDGTGATNCDSAHAAGCTKC